MHACTHTCHPFPLSSCCGGVTQRGWWLLGRWRCSTHTRWCKKLVWMWWEHLDCLLSTKESREVTRAEWRWSSVKMPNNESQILTIYSLYGCVWEWQRFRRLWLLNSCKVQAMKGKDQQRAMFTIRFIFVPQTCTHLFVTNLITWILFSFCTDYFFFFFLVSGKKILWYQSNGL